MRMESVTVGIIVVLSMGLLVVPCFSGQVLQTRPTSKVISAQYSSVQPISITRNEEIAAFASAGNGSASNPFLIDGILIESISYCLRLENTTAHVVVSNSYFSAVERNIRIQNVSNLVIHNSTFDGGNYGAYIYSSTNVSISECRAAGSSIAVFLLNSHNITIRTSMLYDGDIGVDAGHSTNLTIRENRIYGNSIGVSLNAGSANCSTFQNKIGWNRFINARDEGEDNVWWNNDEGGNLWSDFAGGLTYEISGSAGAIDEDPDFLADLQPPQVTGPQDRFVVQGETSTDFEWEGYDEYPLNVQLFIDSEKKQNQTWIPYKFSITTGELEIGTHNYTAIFVDARGNSVRDVALITVTVSIFGGLGTTILLASSILSVIGVVVVIFILKRTPT